MVARGLLGVGAMSIGTIYHARILRQVVRERLLDASFVEREVLRQVINEPRSSIGA